MKKRYLIAPIMIALTFSGCSAVKFIPKKHDSAAYMTAINLRVDLNLVKCDPVQYPSGWETVLLEAEKIALYATTRKEAQADNASSMLENLQKAAEGGALCQPMLNLSKTKADIIIEAWRGRR